MLTGGVSVLLHAGYFMLLQRGYRGGDVSVVYPLARGLGPLLSVILAIALLGERPGWIGVLGAGVVIAGVLVIGFAGGREGASKARAGVRWGLIIGVAIATYTLWDAYSVTDLAVPPTLHMLVTSAGQAMLFAPLALRDRAMMSSEVARNWRAAVAVGVLSPLSYLLILVAFQLAPVALVAPGREVSVVLVALAGWLVFNEPHPRQRILGAVIVIVGVILLTHG